MSYSTIRDMWTINVEGRIIKGDNFNGLIAFAINYINENKVRNNRGLYMLPYMHHKRKYDRERGKIKENGSF